MSPGITLFSHHGCPYVQRVAIVLAEKQMAHLRHDVDLHDKPAEFDAASPLGLVPVLKVGSDAIFDSAVICEYLDETHAPRLHPEHPLQRARHRAWMAYGTALLQAVGGFFKARDEPGFEARRAEIIRLLQRLEAELTGSRYFAGPSFCMVDVVFAPVFRYFDAFALMEPFDYFASLPKAKAWRRQLAQRPSVQAAVQSDFLPRLVAYLSRLDSVLARKAPLHP
jgi:glutathione S-transferase